VDDVIELLDQVANDLMRKGWALKSLSYIERRLLAAKGGRYWLIKIEEAEIAESR